MKDQRKTEIRVGITVVIALLVFLWILGWAKNFSFVSNEREIKIGFQNVAGLEVGDNVTVNGVREGYVKSMDVAGDKVNVVVSISKNVKLKSDAAFYVAMLDLMGGKKIEIKPGTSGDEFDYSTEHEGVFAPDIASVMSFAGNMQDDVTKTLKDIEVTLSSINNYLTDDKFNSEVKTSVSNLNKATGQLNEILARNKENITELLKNSNELAKNADGFIRDNKDDLAGSIRKLNIVLGRTDSLVNKLNSLANETTNGQNNLGKILYDKSFYNNLDQSLKQLNELTGILIKALKNDGIKVDAHISIF